MFKRAALVAVGLLALVIAGCGGGGHSGSPVVPALGNTQSAAGKLTVLIPPKPATSSTGRKPAYISPDTASIGVVVTPQGGSPFPVVMTDVPGTACVVAEGGGYSCTITVQAQPGSNTLTITTYAASDGGGSVLSSGTVVQDFEGGASPAPITVTLTGVVSQVALEIAHVDLSGNAIVDNNVPVGEPATLYVTAEDAAGDAIIGSYDQPINVSISNGLTLGSGTFSDSSQPSTSITWPGAPTYYNAPTGSVTTSAYIGSGSTPAASIALNPTSTVIQFPLGDGQPWDIVPFGLEAQGNTLYFSSGWLPLNDELASPPPSLGEWGTFDVTTGVTSVAPALSFVPASIYVDPTYHGIWMPSLIDEGDDGGPLECFANAAASPVPVALPSSEPINIYSLAEDNQQHLWFSNDDSGVGYASLDGQCSTNADSPPQFVTLGVEDGDFDSDDVIADATGAYIWSPNQDGQDAYAISASGAITDVALPGATGSYSAALDSAGNLAMSGQDDSGFGLIGLAAPGATSFNSTLSGALFSEPFRSAVSGTGANAIYLGADVGIAGVSYTPASSSAATFLGIPNSPTTLGCTGLAIDAQGTPWAACATGTGATLNRIVVTNTWNLFLDQAPYIEDGEQTYFTVAGVAGGDPSLTFTWSCSPNLSCISAPSSRAEEIEGLTSGLATVCVTDSDGRKVTEKFEIVVTEQPSSVRRRPATVLRGMVNRLRQAVSARRLAR